MKHITCDQFRALVKRADRISCDGNTVETYHGDEGSITFEWENDDCNYEIFVETDGEFSFDSATGSASFKDIDSEAVTIFLFIEFPLQEIPFNNKH